MLHGWAIAVVVLWIMETGLEITLTLLNEMKRRNAKNGVATLCVGGGMGAALVFENAQ